MPRYTQTGWFEFSWLQDHRTGNVAQREGNFKKKRSACRSFECGHRMAAVELLTFVQTFALYTTICSIIFSGLWQQVGWIIKLLFHSDIELFIIFNDLCTLIIHRMIQCMRCSGLIIFLFFSHVFINSSYTKTCLSHFCVLYYVRYS